MILTLLALACSSMDRNYLIKNDVLPKDQVKDMNSDDVRRAVTLHQLAQDGFTTNELQEFVTTTYLEDPFGYRHFTETYGKHILTRECPIPETLPQPLILSVQKNSENGFKRDLLIDPCSAGVLVTGERVRQIGQSPYYHITSKHNDTPVNAVIKVNESRTIDWIIPKQSRYEIVIPIDYQNHFVSLVKQAGKERYTVFIEGKNIIPQASVDADHLQEHFSCHNAGEIAAGYIAAPNQSKPEELRKIVQERIAAQRMSENEPLMFITNDKLGAQAVLTAQGEWLVPFPESK